MKGQAVSQTDCPLFLSHFDDFFAFLVPNPHSRTSSFILP